MTSETNDYDVFISYRWVTPDQEWVRDQLAPALERAGLNVCLDVEDFVPGRNVILEMTRAGRSSKVVLCVISPDYVAEDRMVQFEALGARGQDPSGRQSKLIPLVLREGSLPDWMQGTIALDWTNPQNHRREWRRLLEALGAPNLAAALPGESADATPLIQETATPPVRWQPRLAFIKVNDRLVKRYGLYSGALLGASGLTQWKPGVWQDIPFLMGLVDQQSLTKAMPMLSQAMVCSVSGLALMVTVVTGLLNMQIIFSTVKMLFLLALFSFLCALITSLHVDSMIPHLLLALVLVTAFVRHFVLGQLGYYWKRRSLGDVALESILMLAFVVLIVGPIRSVVEGRSAFRGEQVQPAVPGLPAHLR